MNRKLKFITMFVVFLLGMHFSIEAQNKAITVTCERNSNKGYNFSYTKNTEGSYTVFVKINDANNLDETEFRGVVNQFSGTLFSVNSIEKDRSFGFSNYSTSYLRGVPNPKIDTSFVYALPFRKVSPLSVNNLTDLREKYFGDTPTRKMKAFEFSSLDCDTACAIRKGIVVSVTDMYEMDSTIGKSYTSQVNSILIEHPDGTLASYSGFKKGSIFVKEGQKVFPFTALGILAHYDISKKHQLRLSVYYLADIEVGNNSNDNAKNNNSKRYYDYINPYFLTTLGVCHIQKGKKYSVGVSDYVIEHEMTKKELKAIGKKSKTENNLVKTFDKGNEILKDTLYLDAEGNILASSEKASEYSLRWTDPKNEHRKIINVYYMSGKLKEEFFQIDNPQLDFKKPPHWYYKDKDTGHTWFMHGLRQAWYENGQLRRQVEFQNGEINGQLITYWDNSQVKRTNRDSLGNKIPTKCFDRTGAEVAVYPFATTGKFDNGKTTVNDYLKSHIVYPKEALEKSIEGFVEMVINIEPDGTVGNSRTVKSDDPLLEAEVKRVLKTLPKCSTGSYDGEPVPYVLSARYTFKLPTSNTDWLSKLSNQDTTFYDNTGKIVLSKRYCDNYEILSVDSIDKNLAIERVYAFSGKIRSEKYFLTSSLIDSAKDLTENIIYSKVLTQKEINVMKRKIEGRYREWFDNGQLGKDFFVIAGKKHGKLNFYWENGTPRRNDEYYNGELLTGSCYDKTGRLIQYFNLDMPATYPGGVEAMEKYISSNLQYPKTAMQNNIQGTVIVSFVVDNNGNIRQSWISKSVDRDLNIEAVRLVRKMPKWFVELKNGEVVSSIQKVEINFVL
jgi:TonB family protein